VSTVEALWTDADARARRGDAAGARAACEALLRLDPFHSRAHLLLANLLTQRDAWRAACAPSVQAAARMGPQPLEHVAAVSLRLISCGEYEEASRLIHKLDPARVPAAGILVELSQQLGLLEEHADALRYMDAALARGVRAESIGYLRGNTLKFLGRLDEAAQEYERSLAINPNFAYAHWALAYLGRGDADGTRAARIRAAIAATNPDDADAAHLHYALFKELDDAGHTDAAWAALAAGARAKHRRISYDGAAEAALFGELAAATPRGFLDGDADGNRGPAGERTPIFVLGMPRTGTTLLERILGGNPDVTLCGELNDFRMQFKWATDHHCLGFIDATGVARLPAVDFAQLGERYLGHVRWRVPGTRWFSDKSPGNFQLAGLIARALPEARIVHLRRNPMDTCFSNLKELFAANAHPYSYSFDDLAAHYRNYRGLMAHWHDVAPGRILDVRYEDLVADADATARRVMAFCGLPYDPAQVRVEERAAPVSTASSAQVRQPIHRRNVGGWRRYAGPLEPLRARLEAAGFSGDDAG
jgi:tetratricopeptide (TPR) repeat protein